jgi:L(+)-tartrate dehydratase beta subunit
MTEHRVTTPLTDEMVMAFKAGDIVWVSGHIFGLRDATLIHLFDRHVPVPTDLRGAICLHTAPGVKKAGDHYVKVSIGTTTSTRMNRFTGPLLACGVKAIAGKGGLLDDSTQLLHQYRAVYLGLVGGTAAAETMQIEAIEAVWFEQLMPECLWKFRVRDFGPLIVGIDAHGRNLYAETKLQALKTIGVT